MKTDNMNEKYIITIGRQLGSGGREIGKKIAEELSISYYDKELIYLASKESGLSKEFFEKADEKASLSFFDNFFNLQYSKNYLCGETLFEIQSDIIKRLSEKRSCVFVGRCSDYILRENKQRIDIFITADKEDRIKRTALRKNIDEKEAELLNNKVDKKRKEFYNFYSNRGWGRAGSYHLCINSSVLGINDTAQYISEFIRRKLHNNQI
ncbi:AAA family ATPase [Apibacter sp. HY039]|uniref:cytidylate kinase-like family protein n=1 Tax=Apibacter sp. HY039 TaxID=2501476 RepID=UPI001C87A94E|nr:cytidylate kinase-like family protein [Apibacter sp. HY039]